MKIFTRTDKETNKRTLAIFRDELKPERKQLILAAVFIPLQHCITLVVLPLLISFFTQSVITNNHNIVTPLWLIGSMIVSSIIAIIAGHIGFIALFNHEERMTTRLTERAMSGLLAHSHSFFANHKVGSLAGDVNTFSRSYLALADVIFLQASSIVVNFIISLIVIGFIAPIMLPVLFIVTAAIILNAIRGYNNRSELRNERKEVMSQLFGNIADTLGNHTLVRMFARKNHEIQLALNKRKTIEGIATKEIVILQRDAEIRLVIMYASQIIIMLLCLYFLYHALLTIAAFIFIITYLSRLSGTMFALGGIIRQAEQAFLDAAKITEILHQTTEIKDALRSPKLTIKQATIKLKNVRFAYSDMADEPIFQNLSLTIPSGQSIGLAGRSGGGKSTLTHLLLRYMDIQGGEILIDKHNIADVTQDSLRKLISYVPQDPFLFHRTLKENIAYGKPEATDDEIIDAAKKAHVMEFVATLPHGLDTIVGERGVKLSGGQRQRIAIARAILKDAPILILDEATSALDSESEKLIQSALETLMKNRTSIVIAHRLSTIAKLDRIIVLDNGAIVEDGTHAKLLKQNGTYAKLWNHQSGGFIEE